MQTFMFRVLCACHTHSAKSPTWKSTINLNGMEWKTGIAIDLIWEAGADPILLYGRRGWLARSGYFVVSASARFIYLIIFAAAAFAGAAFRLERIPTDWVYVCDSRSQLNQSRVECCGKRNKKLHRGLINVRVRFSMELLLICIVNTRADVPRSVKFKDNLRYSTIRADINCASLLHIESWF